LLSRYKAVKIVSFVVNQRDGIGCELRYYGSIAIEITTQRYYNNYYIFMRATISPLCIFTTKYQHDFRYNIKHYIQNSPIMSNI